MCYVLMSEHVHLLVGETRTASLAVALQVLKQQTSRKLKKPGGPILAAPLLRLQRMDRGEVRRETELHASQPRPSWPGRNGRGLALVQLPPLCHRRAGCSRDRIALGSPPARNTAKVCTRKVVNPTLAAKNRVKDGAPSFWADLAKKQRKPAPPARPLACCPGCQRQKPNLDKSVAIYYYVLQLLPGASDVAPDTCDGSGTCAHRLDD